MEEFTPDTQVVPGTDALLQIVTSVLDEQEYVYQEVDDHSVVLSLRTPHGLFNLCFWANAATNVVQLAGSYGSAVPPDRRVAIAEAAARANLRIGLGAFHLDFADGEIAFHCGLDVEDSWLSRTVVANMIHRTMSAMNRYHDAFMRVAYGDGEPEIVMTELP